MRSAALAAALGVALVASAARADAARLRPWGRGATPELSGRDPAGRSIDLAALRGRVVLVEFWATWCEPCSDELARLAALRDRFAARSFAVVTVNYGEGPARIERFLREHRLDVPVVLDRDRQIARAWGVGGLPMSFLVDARGRVRSSIFGECDWSEPELAAALEALLADAERAPQASSATGRGSGR